MAPVAIQFGYKIEQYINIVILALFTFLALGFSLAPLFEGHDELEHYEYIRYLERHKSLPPLDEQIGGEFHQAPFYYVVMSGFAMLLPDDDFSQYLGRENPYHGYEFFRPGNDNKNKYSHLRLEQFPYRESATARTVHILRLVSVLLGLGTLLILIKIFRLFWPEHPHRRLLALGIAAFWPQFVFKFGHLNNDAMSFFLATMFLWLFLKEQGSGYSWRGSTFLGVVLGMSILTKASMLLLAFLVVADLWFERRAWRHMLLTFCVALILGGWWYLRNAVLYGDPTGTGAIQTTWAALVLPAEESGLIVGIKRSWFAYQTLWARFGHNTIAVSALMYRLYDVLLILAVVGLTPYLVRPHWNKRWLTIGIFPVVLVLSTFHFAGIYTAGNQGRYVLPAMAIIAALLTMGLDTWISKRYKVPVTLLLITGLGSLCFISLFKYYLPAYRSLPVPEEIAHSLDFRYGNHARLIGMSPANPTATPGETIAIELYWQALIPAPKTMQVYLHSAFAEDVIWRDSLPGNGHRPADDWQAGETWAERYVVTIPEYIPPGMEYLLTAGLYDPAEPSAIPVYDADGELTNPVPVIATLVIVEG